MFGVRMKKFREGRRRLGLWGSLMELPWSMLADGTCGSMLASVWGRNYLYAADQHVILDISRLDLGPKH
jgi:hypothetical protein